MRGSYWNRGSKNPKHEIFSQLQVPPDTPFFARLDGRRFQAISEKVGAKKPFDEKFAKCLIASARAVYQSDLNPALVYAASDEINLLFLYTAPFKRRVEKINSVLAGVASSAFSLSVTKFFKKTLVAAFDSRIIVSSQEKIVEYLTWRQRDAWRNHNNAYAYWLFRRIGHKPSEAAKMLKGLKTKELHEILFRHGLNLAKTPAWQRRGILIYREPYQKQVKNHVVTRRRIIENWALPLFSSKEGRDLIQQILGWANPAKEEEKLSESSEQRIEKLNQELASLKEERNKLSLEAKKWAEKRNSIHEQIKVLRTKAANLKEKRDTLNEKVQELKSLRDQAKIKRKEKHAQILKLKEKVRGLTERKPSQSMQNIQREIERLDWKIQTTSLSVKEEGLLINQVRQLEVQLSVHKQIEKSKEELMVLRTEEKTLETEAKTYHEKLSELAEQSQKFHEEMLETFNKARGLKVEADNAHQKYVEIKQQAQNFHQKCVELLGQIKTFRQELREKEEKEQAKRQRELLKELEERALEKLKRGEKLTWEEFKILAEKGRM